MTCTFGSSTSYSRAKLEWSVAMLLVAYNAPGCSSTGGNCYFDVTGFEYDEDTYTITCSGSSKTIKQCMSHVDASWGRNIGTTEDGTRPNLGDGCGSMISSVMSKFLPGWDVKPTAPAGGSGKGDSLNPLPWATGAGGNGGYGNGAGYGYGYGGVKPSSVRVLNSNAPFGKPAKSTSGGPRKSTAIRSRFGHTPSAHATNSAANRGSTGPSGGRQGVATSNPVPRTSAPLPTITGSPRLSTNLPLEQVSSSLHNFFSSLSAGRYVNSSHPVGSPASTSSYDSQFSLSSSPSGSLYSAFGSLAPELGSSPSISGSLSSIPGPSSSISGSSSSLSGSSSSYSFSATLSTSSHPPANSSFPSLNTTSSTNRTNVTWPYSHCARGVDPIYGLPTTCLGPNFDLDLNSVDGLVSLSDTDFSGIQLLFPGLIPAKIAKLRKRCGFLDLICLGEEVVDDATSLAEEAYTAVSSFGSSVISEASSDAVSAFSVFTTDLASLTNFVGSEASSIASGIVSIAEAVGEDISDATADIIGELENGLNLIISVHAGTGFSINISPPQDDLVESPWGDQMLIKSFSSKNKAEEGGKEKRKRAYTKREEGGEGAAGAGEGETGSGAGETDVEYSLNIFCVDCGVTVCSVIQIRCR
jgi:hypothetical protein